MFKDTITGSQLVTSSEDKLRGMVVEMNQTLKELSGSVTDTNGDPKANQVTNVTLKCMFVEYCEIISQGFKISP